MPRHANISGPMSPPRRRPGYPRRIALRYSRSGSAVGAWSGDYFVFSVGLLLVMSRADLNPLASVTASSFAQKCM
jgi:hypothetical protein